MERCVCCNARLSGQITCPRCQANLADVMDSGQQAQQLLEHAMQLWFAQEAKLAVLVLTKALVYQRTPAIVVFRDFVIRQSCPKILSLLANHHYHEAEQWLQLLRALNPRHALLAQLQGFSRYLIRSHLTTLNVNPLDFAS